MGCQSPQRLGPDSATPNGGSTNRVHCFGAVANPLIAGSPDIDWDLTFTFRWGDSRIHYTVEGCHDGFPAYEAYMNNSPLMQHSDNGRISSLFPPCDRTVYETGDIF
jgi:hypothetical protein